MILILIKSKLAEVEDDEVEQQEVQGGHCEEGECTTRDHQGGGASV